MTTVGFSDSERMQVSFCPSFLNNPETLCGAEQGSAGSDLVQGFRGCVGWGDICIEFGYSSASEVNRIFMCGMAETMEDKVLIIEKGYKYRKEKIRVNLWLWIRIGAIRVMS